MAQAASILPTADIASAASERPADAKARRDLALDAQKRSFLRMASHELRTPLNSILGFSEIIAAELYGPLGAPQYKEYAAIIRTSGERLLRLVNQVLDIARLEGGAMDLDLRAESVEAAIEDVLEGLSPDIEARGSKIAITDEGALPLVRADSRGLRTVLCNLLQNAVAFSYDASIITISAVRLGPEVEIAVADQGPGVDPAELPRLMRPFEQGENALTRRAEGAGLGLPIVELLTRAMGGRFRITAIPGAGFTAYVRLPAG
jgi:signal transduction histidine kinase